MPALEFLEDRTVPSTLTVLNNADSGAGSLRDTIAAASPGDTIVFARTAHHITLTSGDLSITQNLDIEGPGATQLTISGNDASRIFDISGGASVTIAGMTIVDGAAVGLGIGHSGADLGGGGIVNEPGTTLTLSNCVLSGNIATAASATVDVFGGGLLNEGTATVNRCLFRDNQVLGGGSFTFFGGTAGGGIDNFGGATLNVNDSVFTNNQSISAAGPYFAVGGAIENNAGFDVANPSTATISNCIFSDNLAQGGAGADSNGGALDNEGFGTTMTVIGSLLIGNEAVGGSGADGVTALGQGIGGGVVNGLGTLTLRDCSFLGNEAIGGNGSANVPSQGIGSAGGGGLTNFFTTTTVIQCAFIGNQAIGGASLSGPGGIGQGGGILNVSGGTLNVSDSRFIENTARGGPGAPGAVGGMGAGGGIDTFSGTGVAGTVDIVNVTRSIFAGNQSLGGMGGAGAAGGVGVGGAIAVGQDAYFGLPDSPSLTLTANIFEDNLAEGGTGGAGGMGGDGWGGALAVVSGTATDTGSAFAGNTALGGTGGAGGNGGNGLGGGLFNNTGATLTLSHSTVVHNQALGGSAGAGGSAGQGIGGGVYNLGAFSFDASTIIENNHASTSNDNIFP